MNAVTALEHVGPVCFFFPSTFIPSGREFLIDKNGTVPYKSEQVRAGGCNRGQ